MAATAALLPLALAACNRAPAYRVYATNEFSGDLSVIDPSSRAVMATVPLGKRPRGVRGGQDGKTLYISMTGSPVSPPGVDESTLPPPDKSADGIGVFDIASGKVTKVLRGVSDPEQLAVGADGMLYAPSEDQGSVVEIDPAAGRVVASIPVGDQPEGVAISPDGKRLFTANGPSGDVTIVDAAGLTVVGKVKAGDRPWGVAVAPAP